MNEILPAMMGQRRTELLKNAFDEVVSRLMAGAHIRQVGSMSSRGELDIMRLVIAFPTWEMIPEGLARIGWKGETTLHLYGTENKSLLQKGGVRKGRRVHQNVAGR